MCVERLFALRRLDSFARAVRQDAETLLVIHQIGLHDLIEHVLVNRRVEQWNERLDASIQIALHEIGGRNEHPSLRTGQPMAGAKRVDPRMFQKSANDRLNSNVVGETGTPGRRQQIPRITMSICTPARLAP